MSDDQQNRHATTSRPGPGEAPRARAAAADPLAGAGALQGALLQRKLQRRLEQRRQSRRAEPGLRLQTALDSRLVVRGGPDRYRIALRLDDQVELEVGEFERLGCDPSLRALPIHIEDLVTPERALVRIRFDPARVRFTAAAPEPPQAGAADGAEDGARDLVDSGAREAPPPLPPLVVQATPVPPEELETPAGPRARPVRGGHVAEGGASVAEHRGKSEVDLVMSSVVSAEGGFAATEGADGGIFTWGQGQWTVAHNLLQPLLAFIKERRADLFARYFGAAALDVVGGVLTWKGQAFATAAELSRLFHASPEQNRHFVELFAQAGQDPQIQRLQRQYQRNEVSEVLRAPAGGQVPERWLTTRGKAYYYSMWVNAPAIAGRLLSAAVAAGAAGASEPTPERAEAVSLELERLYQRSRTVSTVEGRIVAFWSEVGRARALAQADQHIAEGRPDELPGWQRHRATLLARPSRFASTRGDIDRALRGEPIEPDLPYDAQVCE